LLGQVTILVCLANEKAKERKRAEDKKAHQITNLQKEVSHFQADNFEVDRLHSESTRWAQEKVDLYNQVKQMEKVISDLNEGTTRKEVDLSKTIDALKDDVASSYVVGFKAALEQATIIHPIIDLS